MPEFPLTGHRSEISSVLLPEKLRVQAAGVNGFGADPAPNLIIVSVTDEDGRPVTGLDVKNFTVVNYAMTDGHARLVQLRTVVEVAAELHGTGMHGVYKVEPEQEPEITRQVGQTAYAVMVTMTRETPTAVVSYAGQTVLSILMQPRP